MFVRNRGTFVPVFLWTLLCTGILLLALFQQRTGVSALPSLGARTAFDWIAALLMVYILVIWPLGLETMIERFARQPYAQGIFSVHALQEPLLLGVYVLPCLILAGAFGFKGLPEILRTVAVLAVVGFATWSHFRLGFYIHGSMSRSYLVVAGLLCIAIPLVNLVFSSFRGTGPTWLNLLNPFHTLFRVAGSGDGVGSAFMVFLAVFGGLTVALLSVPVVFSMPQRVFKDIAGL